MISSQILLTLFLGYWLYSQYVENKNLLAAEIERGLRDAEEQVIDSLLATSIINPLMSNDSSNLSVYMIDGRIPDTLNHPHEMKLNLDSVTQMQMHIAGNHAAEQNIIRKVESIDSSVHLNDRRIQSTITVSAGEDSSKQLLFQGIKLLINSVGQNDMEQSSIYTFFASNPDTAILVKIFNEFIEKNYTSFKVDWQSIEKSGINEKKHSNFVFASLLFEDPYGIAITNYNPYILKAISPQIVFAFILLLITALAFRLAFLNLKNQRKLLTLKNDFISNITHELKTPVSTVKVALEALLDFNRRNDPKLTKDYLEMAHKEMDRLDLLVNQVLNNSALEDGNSFISTENINLVLLVNEVRASLQPRFDEQMATVTFNFSDNEIFAEVDKLHLHGVILNLLDNSLKYTEQKPEISIDISQDNKETLISISDNGIGIPIEYRDKIFDKFFRVPMGDKHNVKGYGLGLNYAAIVMEHHHGKIWADNIAAGGCRFTLSFPNLNPTAGK